MKKLIITIAIILLTIQANAQWKLEKPYMGVCYDEMKWTCLQINIYGDSQVTLAFNLGPEIYRMQDRCVQDKNVKVENFGAILNFEVGSEWFAYMIDTINFDYITRGNELSYNDTAVKTLTELGIILKHDITTKKLYELFCKSTNLFVEIWPLYPAGHEIYTYSKNSYGAIFHSTFNMSGSTKVIQQVLAAAKTKMVEKPKE